MSEVRIRRTGNGWYVTVLEEGELPCEYVYQDPTVDRNPAALSLQELLWEQFTSCMRSKHTPGLVVEFKDSFAAEDLAREQSDAS